MPTDAIAAVLGPGGLLAQASESYEHRPQQLQMARVIRRALEERRYAIVEAGTGTGKTLGYLLPAVLSGRRVVISTATKTLQDQIVHKDLPLLREVAAVDFSATVLKGRGNYLCHVKLEKVEADPGRLLPTKQDVKALPRISEWAKRTKEGDRGELDIPDNLQLWRELSATSETCLGQKCERFEDCFVTRARRKAAESDLV
ncbi:MAG: ATP-dependent DNA helicase, partial [Myxococcales bacterium]